MLEVKALMMYSSLIISLFCFNTELSLAGSHRYLSRLSFPTAQVQVPDSQTTSADWQSHPNMVDVTAEISHKAQNRQHLFCEERARQPQLCSET